MMEPGEGKENYTGMLTSMCKDNFAMSKKIAKVYVKGINKSYDNLDSTLEGIANFLRIDDSLKQLKLEWILGVPQVVNKKNWSQKTYEYGIELVEKVSDEAYTYETKIMRNSNEDSCLQQILKAKGRVDTNCCKAIRMLL